MMRGSVPCDCLTARLMGTVRYRGTVEWYLNVPYDEKFQDVLESFLSRNNTIVRESSSMTTTKPSAVETGEMEMQDFLM